eukprot:10493474-Lingulodinium_polyedra.AAC.1
MEKTGRAHLVRAGAPSAELVATGLSGLDGSLLRGGIGRPPDYGNDVAHHASLGWRASPERQTTSTSAKTQAL